jgi:Calx-beta domain
MRIDAHVVRSRVSLLFAVVLVVSVAFIGSAYADAVSVSGPADTDVIEGYVGMTEVSVPITASGAHDPFTVDWATMNGTAKASVPPRMSDDYVAGRGTLSFAATDSEQAVTLTVRSDGILENNEYLSIVLSNATAGIAISSAPIRVTILNDEMPKLRLVCTAPPPIRTEGKSVTFAVQTSQPTIFSVVVQVVTDPFVTGTATSVFDYGVVNQWVTIPPETTGPVKLKITTYLDGITETDESFPLWAVSQETINQLVVKTITIKANTT